MKAIGPYDVLGELGRGGMGVVLRSRHRVTGAECALKLLGSAADQDALARFRREAEALARVAGAGVVPIHEVLLHEGRPCLVLALMPGGSLEARLRGGPIPWREAAAIARDLARTLARCHAVGLVHRDLKPANVLFDASGAPCLADFGIARDLHAGSLTESGALLGTPAFMAPEQLDGARAGPPADVHALAALLQQCVTGASPFGDASSVLRLLEAKHAGRRARIPTSLAPAELETLLARALDADPGRRPVAAALARDLEALLARAGPAARKAGPVAGRRLVLGLGALAALIVVGGVTLARALGPRVTAATPPRRPSTPTPATSPPREPTPRERPTPLPPEPTVDPAVEVLREALRASNADAELPGKLASLPRPLAPEAAELASRACARWREEIERRLQAGGRADPLGDGYRDAVPLARRFRALDPDRPLPELFLEKARAWQNLHAEDTESADFPSSEAAAFAAELGGEAARSAAEKILSAVEKNALDRDTGAGFLGRASRRVPGSGPLALALGLVLSPIDSAGAEAALRRALGASDLEDEGRWRTRVALASLLSEKGAAQEALDLIRDSAGWTLRVHARPRGSAFRLLARLHLLAGNRERALSVLERGGIELCATDLEAGMGMSGFVVAAREDKIPDRTLLELLTPP